MCAFLLTNVEKAMDLTLVHQFLHDISVAPYKLLDQVKRWVTSP
jgi:non-ribosomal peptide synthetase component E (peptide arylation enzyme)